MKLLQESQIEVLLLQPTIFKDLLDVGVARPQHETHALLGNYD